jgi:two-component system phosphate regulon sensor histidine kinase PhoR
VKLGLRAKLIVASIFAIAISALVADTTIRRSLDADLTASVERDLGTRARLVALDLAAHPADAGDRASWDQVADSLAVAAEARVTIIGSAGELLGDSELDVGELGRAEDHSDREEVREALTTGLGAHTRLSSTVRRRMMYVAVPFRSASGVEGVGRVAVPLTQVDAAVARVRSIVYAGAAVALLLAIFMATLGAHWVSRSVRAFTSVARRLSAGDLDARTRAEGADEVAELGRALDRLASSLSKALGELRSERDLLGKVLDGMREGVLLVNHDGKVALANPALREMLLLGADVVGKRPLELIRSAELKALLDRAGQDGEGGASEIEVGELKPRKLLIDAVPLPDIRGILAVFVDVTDVRRLESLRRDFVANVSHELRTPIATVLSAAETLHGGAMGTDAAEEFLEIIERNATRLHRLVEDLLDLSRIESRELKLSLEPVDLGAVIGAVLPLYRERADQKKVVVSVELAAGVRPRADARALETVLSNLIDNAVKYTSVGSRVTIRSVEQDDTVALSVSDTGPGIAPKHLPRLFERFYRADAGRSRELGGTGLGLSIVKNLTEAMGGAAEVESQVGRGATFRVTLPRA